ncbi:MAG: hypothetical protein WAL63_22055 [Solirubrobacteraceae bacterium]
MISIPTLVSLDLHLVNDDSAAHSVVLTVPGRPTVHLSPGAGASASVPFLHGGTYRILVDGSARGQLLVGAQGGP